MSVYIPYTRYIFLALILFMAVTACDEVPEQVPRPGDWHATLELMDGRKLPFNFSLARKNDIFTMEVYNAEEVIHIDEILVKGDSIFIYMPVFEGYIKGVAAQDTMQGSFIIESLNRSVPFEAVRGNRPRFYSPNPASAEISGNWQVHFGPDTESGYPGQGIFSQTGQKLTGTFRTLTGDYRFLEGVVSGDSLKLSTFDGAHAYLFEAVVRDSLMEGFFYSGNHFKTPFKGQRNPGYELMGADSQIYLKEGYEKLEFDFPNDAGTRISLNDEQFRNKVVIVQIMGTWCPNCLDETRFLTRFQDAHADEGVQVVALAFEYAKTKEKAFNAIRRLKERVGVNYPVLLAQYGSNNKEEANQKLPMLNQLLSYPTTILLDKEGRVRKIYSGFNGPATGDKYLEFQSEFDALVGKLLEE